MVGQWMVLSGFEVFGSEMQSGQISKVDYVVLWGVPGTRQSDASIIDLPAPCPPMMQVRLRRTA